MNKLENRFTFIEQLPQDELLKYYKDANVFVMHSIMEAMGQVYMEGMSSKTPVIGADVGGVGEIITPEVGYLVKPQSHEAVAEAIKEVFLDKKKAEEMGQKGHERATGYFTVERQMRETIGMYKSLA